MAENLTPPKGLDVGDGRTIGATFTTSAGGGASVDLSDVHLTVKAPDGTETVYTGAQLTDAGGGQVSFEIVFTAGGIWRWGFEWDDGVNQPQAQEGYVVVRKPNVTRNRPVS